MLRQTRVAFHRRLTAVEHRLIGLNAAGVLRPLTFPRLGNLLMLSVQVFAHCRNMRALRAAAVISPGNSGIVSHRHTGNQRRR